MMSEEIISLGSTCSEQATLFETCPAEVAELGTRANIDFQNSSMTSILLNFTCVARRFRAGFMTVIRHEVSGVGFTCRNCDTEGDRNL